MHECARPHLCYEIEIAVLPAHSALGLWFPELFMVQGKLRLP